MTDLDQKGLEAAQAYISERMAGTGLAPLFATPIIRAYFSAIPSEQGRAEMTNLDQKALVEAKSAAMQALGYRHGDTVVIGNIRLNIGGAVQSAIAAYLIATYIRALKQPSR